MHQTSCRREFPSQSSIRCSSNPRTCVASEHDVRAAFEEIGKLDHLDRSLRLAGSRTADSGLAVLTYEPAGELTFGSVDEPRSS